MQGSLEAQLDQLISFILFEKTVDSLSHFLLSEPSQWAVSSHATKIVRFVHLVEVVLQICQC